MEGGNGLEDQKLCALDEVFVDVHIKLYYWPFILMREVLKTRHISQGMSNDRARMLASAVESELFVREYIDGLTGIHNKRYLLEFLDYELAQSGKQRSS